ncbi:MAG: glucoamylase family protein [Candidatus Limnocylindrales bacterium]
MNAPATTCGDDATLERLQRVSFSYFVHETNPANGLVIDKTAPDWPASIAAVGLALASYPVGVERGLMTRAAALQRTLATLRFFWTSPQGPEPDATGYRGFYYHFLDLERGRRAWRCELSTVDSALLLAGALTAGSYFDADSADEREVRSLADGLYRRADWQWAQHGGATVVHGWKPESGFLKYRWEGYDEALLLYVLGLGSPTFPLPESSYAAWTRSYQWRTSYGHDYLYAGPLFTHQLSHLWIDFRGIQDAYMRERGIDYFENSRRATYVQRAYAIDNPLKFARYSDECWGITASDGPGPATIKIDGVRRQFFDYVGRGVPDGPDDGTVAPWAVVASLPFAPEIVLPAIRYYVDQVKLVERNPYGFKATFNPTYPKASGAYGWVSPWHFGLSQGPIVLMIENYRTGLVWQLMRRSPPIMSGLRRAGFRGGWL